MGSQSGSEIAAASFTPTSICLTCRTALARGEACDGGRHHRVVDLDQPAGREAHLQEIWGPASRQRRLRELVRAGAAGSGVGAILDGLDCGGADLGDSLAAIVLCAIVFVALGYVIGRLRDAIRRRRHLRPYGALDRPVLPRGHGSRQGVAQGTPHPSPLCGEPCLAFSIVLRSTRPGALAGDVLWREANTTGFTVRLDDGETVRIPPGRIRIGRGSGRELRVSREKAARRLPAGLGVEVDDELSLLPFDRAFEDVIRPDDRVAILSRVERREERGESPASLRAPATIVLVAVGTPVIVCE